MAPGRIAGRQQQALRTYAAALDHSRTVKGRRRPVVKRRKDTLPSLEYTTRGFCVRAPAGPA